MNEPRTGLSTHTGIFCLPAWYIVRAQGSSVIGRSGKI